jgi:hypothetical protein
MSFFDNINKLRKPRSSTPDPGPQHLRTQSPGASGQLTWSPTKTSRSTAALQVVDLRTRTQPSASLPPTPSPIRTVLKPRSAAEQYWAARALTAETLLSARATHHKELKNLAYSEEIKRAVCSPLTCPLYLRLMKLDLKFATASFRCIMLYFFARETLRLWRKRAMKSRRSSKKLWCVLSNLGRRQLLIVVLFLLSWH